MGCADRRIAQCWHGGQWLTIQSAGAARHMTLLVAARQPSPGASGLSRRVVSRSGWPLAGGPVSVHDQVVAAYTGYWQALGQALDTRDAARARAILARYTVPALIP